MFGTSSLRSFKKSHIGILSQNSLFHLHYRESASASIAAIRIMEVQNIQAPAFTSALDQNNCIHKPHLPWPEGVWKKNGKKHASKLLLNVVSKPESVKIVLQRNTAKEASWMNCHIDTAQ